VFLNRPPRRIPRPYVQGKSHQDVSRCLVIPAHSLRSPCRADSDFIHPHNFEPERSSRLLRNAPRRTRLVEELEVQFPPDQVRWRVTNTTTDKKRGQIVPYADPRAYTDRLNAHFSPEGWTREYKIETMNNLTRVKKGESLLSGKVLVTCTVTILGIGSHSGTGEDWAEDDNGMTSADAQAFKRSCSCFGLGRYFYDFPVFWVDLDQNRQPVRTLALSGWRFRRTGAKECGLRARTVMEKPTQALKVRARMEEAKATNYKEPLAAAGRQMAAALIGKVQPKRPTVWLALSPVTTISMGALCAWKRRLAQPSIAAFCASTVASTSRN
jgi:hypothetical protein